MRQKPNAVWNQFMPVRVSAQTVTPGGPADSSARDLKTPANMAFNLEAPVHRLPSPFHRPPSTVYRLPSTIYRLPSPHLLPASDAHPGNFPVGAEGELDGVGIVPE